MIYDVVNRIFSLSQYSWAFVRDFLQKILKIEEEQRIDGLLGGVRTIAMRLHIC